MATGFIGLFRPNDYGFHRVLLLERFRSSRSCALFLLTSPSRLVAVAPDDRLAVAPDDRVGVAPDHRVAVA